MPARTLTSGDLKDNLHDIQDNVVAPILMRYGRHIFVKFTDGAKARAWLRNMFNRVNARQEERRLGDPKRLQALVSESDIDGEARPMLFRSSVDAPEHVAQPCARFRAIVKLQEDVAPVPQKDGRDDIVLNVM